MYNLINGVSKACLYFLPMLGKHPDEYPRFRDCFLKDAQRPEYDGKIHVYTRVGGGNRGDYIDEIKALQDTPGYVADYDDEHDNTYAMFVFEIPEKWKKDFCRIMSGEYTLVSTEYVAQLKKVLPKLSEQIDKHFSGHPERTDVESEPAGSIVPAGVLKEDGILSATWYTPLNGACIGIVKYRTANGEIKYYIGNGIGIDERVDRELIVSAGARFYPEMLD